MVGGFHLLATPTNNMKIVTYIFHPTTKVKKQHHTYLSLYTLDMQCNIPTYERHRILGVQVKAKCYDAENMRLQHSALLTELLFSKNVFISFSPFILYQFSRQSKSDSVVVFPLPCEDAGPEVIHEIVLYFVH